MRFKVKLAESNNDWNLKKVSHRGTDSQAYYPYSSAGPRILYPLSGITCTFGIKVIRRIESESEESDEESEKNNESKKCDEAIPEWLDRPAAKFHFSRCNRLRA